MGRLLEFLLVVALLLTIARLWRDLRAPRRPAPPAAGFEPWARCARCDVHVPAGRLDARSLCPDCAKR